ncbi:MAG: hypothetical protein U5R06_24795 [candidate division KSB1 bacterium]|nr:hypothetical protein [candidate division KSB1 bacterium]
MKQITVLFLIVLSAALCARDFENAWWGMTRSEVISIESRAPVQETEHLLIYESTISGFPAYAAYSFVNGRLYSGKYLFNTSHTDNNEYISDYHILLDHMMSRYGLPVQRGKRWQAKTKPQDFSSDGDAVALGHLNYLSCWQTDTSNIEFILTGDHHMVNTVMRYTCAAPMPDSGSIRGLHEYTFFRNGFRGHPWYANASRVKSKECAVLLNTYSNEFVDSLDYDTVCLAGLDMLIGYAFADDRLIAGYYTAELSCLDLQDAISAFHRINRQLQQFYGKAVHEELLWTQQQLKTSYPLWGCAVALGHLTYITDYRCSASRISVTLTSNHGGIILMIQMTPESRLLHNATASGQSHQMQRLAVPVCSGFNEAF